VKETTTPAHVLERNLGSNGDIQRILVEIVPDEVGLEERAHLRVTGSGVVEDQEVNLERGHEDQNRDDDEADDAGRPVVYLLAHCESGIAKLVPEVFNGVNTNERRNEESDHFHADDKISLGR
jgi:hypothetical protein